MIPSLVKMVLGYTVLILAFLFFFKRSKDNILLECGYCPKCRIPLLREDSCNICPNCRFRTKRYL